MPFDWTSLALDTEGLAGKRLRPPADEDDEKERHRRPAQLNMQTMAPSRSAGSSFMPARSTQAWVSAKQSFQGHTIDSVLQPPRDIAPAMISGLFSRVGANSAMEMEEENRRGGGGGGGAKRTEGEDKFSSARSRAASSANAARAAVAAGAQPVVIKVTSTVSGRASAANLVSYLGTRLVKDAEGNSKRSDIPVYDQDGRLVGSAQERRELLAEWIEGFRDEYTVDAIVTMSLTLAQDVTGERLHNAINAVFGSNPFLYSRDGDVVSVYGVRDINAKKLAAALKARAGGEVRTAIADTAEKSIAGGLNASGVDATVHIEGAATSETSGRYFLEKFIRQHPDYTTPSGLNVNARGAAREQATSTWEAWRSQIRTVQPRNAFHVVFSARSGTDAEAFNRAVRDFLSEQVPGHRWVTVHHPDTGHVHVHAMVAARDLLGKALRLTKPELYQWREAFAEKARQHGIAMVATRRADLAATRPFSQAQAGAYARGRSDPHYLKRSTVVQRVDMKREGRIDEDALSDGNLALAPRWKATALALQSAQAAPSVIQAAQRFATLASNKMVVADPKGFLIVKIELASKGESLGTDAIVSALGIERGAVLRDGHIARVLLPTGQSISKIERELAKQDHEFGSGGETRHTIRELAQTLSALGIHASITIEAAGSARNGKPTPWLTSRFMELGKPSAQATPGRNATHDLAGLIHSLMKQKEQQMALSLEQFDERVARANKSMDRLETIVDSSSERQAVEEMRREIAALFAEQRQQIELDQMRSVGSSSGGAAAAPSATTDTRQNDRPRAANIDPAITAQQQAIAQGRAERSAREQSAQSKTAQDMQRQQILKDAESQRQAQRDRDGQER